LCTDFGAQVSALSDYDPRVPETVVTLRPQIAADLPLLVGGDSPFDDFGPVAKGQYPAPARLDDAGALAVVDEAGQLAGDISWHWRGWGPNAGSRCVMIGIWLRPEHRGRGLGRLAQRQLAELFFTHTRVNRVEAHTDVENVAEQRALEAAGFTREGTTRGAQWRDGAYHDGHLYAVLRADLRTG
jgi:RimJ/RimL family protein N-acetyltransferase